MTDTPRSVAADPGVTRDGFDRIGPFHPALVWVAVLLLDLLVVLAALSLLTVTIDGIEDILFPGGPEWIDF